MALFFIRAAIEILDTNVVLMWKPTPSAPGFPSGRVVRLYGAVRSDVKVGTFAAIIGTSQGQCELFTNIWGTDLPRADLDVERRAIKLGHSVLLFDAIAIRLSACWHLDLERLPGLQPGRHLYLHHLA